MRVIGKLHDECDIRVLMIVKAIAFELPAIVLQGEAEQVPQKVGIIRERCTAIMRAPRDNRAAIGVQLTKVRLLLVCKHVY